jgi:hypothetical protein
MLSDVFDSGCAGTPREYPAPGVGSLNAFSVDDLFLQRIVSTKALSTASNVQHPVHLALFSAAALSPCRLRSLGGGFVS